MDTELHGLLERCHRRRIQAWDELEEYENGGPLVSSAGMDMSSIMIERAKKDIELFDTLISSIEALVAENAR
jgi:hypothetical protein